MTDQLKRILNLVRKTGDTMIVTDPNGEDVYVVMGLDQYENLREIENFDPEMEMDDLEGYTPPSYPAERNWTWDDSPVEMPEEDGDDLLEKTPDIWSTMRPAGEEGETWDLTKMSDDEVVDLEEQYKKYAQAPEMSIVPEVKIEPKTEEIPPKLAENEDEFGEEQFYLEPIE